nr:RNA-directed DNA polymerase, eukaryota [Tanacetum cinerariifolium]
MGFYKQNSLQSKFDQASRISKSVFVSNFPKGCTAKDLWKVCNDYGTVVDVFISNKKFKAGKRFAFVRFIKYAMGKVKYVNSIPNLRTLLMDESFSDVKLKYLGAHSPFSEDVSVDDRESDVEEVSETIFSDNSSSPNNNSDEMGKQHSEDPFKIYDILKKQTRGETREMSSSLSHPLGFTPKVSEIQKENDQGAEEFPSLVNAKVINNSQEVYQEINRESVDLNVVKKGGSILEVLEDMIRVGQAMGYTMDGCVKDFERIIGTQGADDALHQASCKRVLWEYVSTLIGRWNGKTIILGDFNEIEAKDSFQKSKIKWAIEGDENSKFFHGIINKKRSQLAIRGVFNNGLWCTDLGKLSDMQAADLERNVSRDEIRLAVWNYGENKSPGPDGYTFEFFRKY